MVKYIYDQGNPLMNILIVIYLYAVRYYVTLGQGTHETALYSRRWVQVRHKRRYIVPGHINGKNIASIGAITPQWR